ncbi:MULTISPECIES: tripartite tricarboxylate transporter substrate binding protein [unclassified Polaromonas]|uniref:Bug family tripartite tricarboxylate transporter substrate binding protein n=1 Tax=unclassified Polaromonas TaxID=2638319 RepID=UPI0018CBC731|nr:MULTISPECIES: tripartite tricarboxylate transporter substrate binding protein [unclassified Polaromonas]MBG6070319.1 tripartite-type tricarboxylate transporter receptor subunit TctC [Polaromonas sp. CG_9.7]MBG6112317.1 tripartite-type tricarboxylate transporter receptor subunit TctC [Polaromonas sp. CG_9.2]
MHYPRTLRRWISVALLALPLAAVAAYPEKSIEWVVPYPAGGGSDVVARILSLPMSRTLGQPIIINNKPGAATNIGADYAAKARPDGYVMLTGDTATMAANPALYSKLSYNVEKDFTPVGLMARFPLILVVNPGVPAKNLTEFMVWAKKQPDGVNFATPGAGSPHHLATELFRERSGLKMVHVGYRGAAPAVQDVIGGQVPMMFVDTASGYQHIQSGRLVAIGVASPKRIATFSTLPTLAEQGLKGFEAYAWQGLVVPAATPPEAVNALSKALLAALDSTEVKARFQTLGLEAIPSTPAQMDAYAKAEREKWAKVIRASNIRLD